MGRITNAIRRVGVAVVVLLLCVAAALFVAFQKRVPLVQWLLERELHRVGAGELSVQVGAVSSELLRIEKISFSLPREAGVVAVSAENVSAYIRLELPRLPELTGIEVENLSVQDQGKKTAGDGSLRIPSEFFSLPPLKLSRVCYEDGTGVRLCSGGELSRKEDQSRISFSGLTLSHPLLVISGGRGQLFFLPEGSKKNAPVSSLFLETVDPGIPAEEVSLRGIFGGSSPGQVDRIRIDNGRAKIFGTGFEMKDGELNLRDRSFTGTVAFAGLDIERVLTLYPQEKITASGSVSGSAVLSWSGEELTLSSGVIRSDPPGGHIAAPGLSAESVGDLGADFSLVQQALSDYQYDSLEGTIAYEKGGDLKLSLSIKGISPALSKERPLHLNLSVEENVPKLLESLRVVRRIHESVESSLNEKQ